MSFTELGLAPELARAVAERGYAAPTPIQRAAIPSVLAGRDVLAATNLVFAAGLAVLSLAPGAGGLVLAWIILGIGMGFGLYEAAFATVAGLYGRDARNSITGITLLAGFASTVGWPTSATVYRMHPYASTGKSTSEDTLSAIAR